METRERGVIQRYGLAERAEMLARQTKAEIRRVFDAYDLAEFEARLHAADMVALLVGLAKDPTLHADTRRACANDVLDRAYGRPVTKMQLQRLDPQAEADQGVTIEARIESARVAADEMAELDRYLGKVPPDQWPQWVHERIGEAGVAAYAEISAEGGDTPLEKP